MSEGLQHQGSEEWLRARVGKVTASRVSDVVARTKTGWGASRANYMAELVAERLTGIPAPQFTSQAMRWGTETEPLARAAYEFKFDVDVTTVGFIPHPTIAMTGASPDGLVGDVGLVEFKCPNTATHIDTLLGAAIDKEYALQMQWQMACTDRKWCDFVSFDPRMPPAMQLHVRRVARDEILIATLVAGVAEFLDETGDKIIKLNDIYLEKDKAA